MEALLVALVAAVIIWATEILTLAANGWEVKRNTPLANLLGARGSSFCSVFWGTLGLYVGAALVIEVAMFLFVTFLVGIVSICGGLGMEQEDLSYAVLFVTCLLLVLKTLEYLGKCIGRKISNTKDSVTKFSEDQKKIKAMKEVYKALKEKYCPIIK